MKKICIFILLLLLVVPTCVSAETLNDLYDRLEKLETQYNTNKNKENLTEEQIKQINTDIGKINVSITDIREEIKKTEEDIVLSKDKISDKQLETDGLIKFLQISNGGNIYLEYLFDAENYTDFIYRYEVVKQLSNYNSDLIKELEALIIELNEKEVELEEQNVKLANERDKLSTKLGTLKLNLKSYQSEGASIESDIEKLKEDIESYEERGCAKDQDLNTCTAMVNAKGWKYPLAKGCVTSEYTGFNVERPDAAGGYHTGIDLGCAYEGTPVYPAADGIVARVIERAGCGGNMIYVRHIVNGKEYTTSYFHLLKFGNGINKYTKDMPVTTNTVIGYVGGYSTSSKLFPKTGYDGCSYGAHLHFGIAEGNQSSSNYYFDIHSINPREKLYFPQIYGGNFYR